MNKILQFRASIRERYAMHSPQTQNLRGHQEAQLSRNIVFYCNILNAKKVEKNIKIVNKDKM